MATTNVVKFYFLINPGPPKMRQYMALAYQAARTQNLHPKAILTRYMLSLFSFLQRMLISLSESSGIHDTTMISGRVRKDPKGLHLTLRFKDATQLMTGTHATCHAYVKNKRDNMVEDVSHSEQKPDETKKAGGDPVWPNSFVFQIDVAYGHVPGEAEVARLLDSGL